MATNPQSFRDTIQFECNKPVELALKYPTGKIIRNGQRVMFTTVDERVLFLDLGPAQRINELGLTVGETFFLAKRRDGRNVEWSAWLSPASEKARALEENPGMETELERQLRESVEIAQKRKLGEQTDGTFVVPKVSGASAGTPAPASAASEMPVKQTPSGEVHRNTLVDDTNALIDAYAATLAVSSTKHGNAVKPEDVRTLLITAYIQRQKGGAYAA
jgi:hypothetical protein